ncbi:hypothetical protein GIB67_033825 [Kingdonia uniflora]|uniref:Peptidase A1 domain-containing protein n=1 Tax=Kingdonia uniflora TaxID=39325 RepID=A0A7J7LIN3_9MAGN|nr:hypothetical protein GIB67_033825 [Kingdonia uniflora]
MKTLKHLKQIRGPDPNYNDICFAGAGSDVSQLSKTFPEVDMVFGNGQKFSLAPENYLFRHSKVIGAYCLGIFQNGKDPTTLLGGIVVRNTLVTYDRENEKVGFLKTNCSDLWGKLHGPGAPSPAPSASYNRNSTAGAPPVMAPSGRPNFTIPAEFQVGLITFDMSLSMNHSDLAPHITELSQLIANDLDIDASQVHLLNFTSKGDEYFLRWGIYPAGSSRYIANSTAMSIIVRLTGRHLKLPDTFGGYQLDNWKLETHPPLKRSWWKQHFLAVVLGVLITMVLGLASFGGWFIWRQRHQAFGTYKPVGAVVPEQELQPL